MEVIIGYMSEWVAVADAQFWLIALQFNPNDGHNNCNLALFAKHAHTNKCKRA